MENCTTYTVTHKNANILWVFKYDLKGNLKAFEIQDKPLTKSQLDFLFVQQKFQMNETQMKETWLKQKKSEFEITIGEPDLSFEFFWQSFDHKIKKIDAERTWNKLSRKDRINALNYIQVYDNYLARKHVDKANPYRYLNKRYWEDNHASIH